MEYPLYIRGQRRGELSVERDGLFTALEIWAESMEGMLRVSVYGEGREGYLGILQPRCGKLWLRKKLSRREMAALPEKIEYAAEAGLKRPGEAAAAPEPPAKEKPTASPASHAEQEDELLWFTRPDGTLRAFDGKHTIVAIPAKLRREIPGAVLKRIGGREYMLFRY